MSSVTFLRWENSEGRLPQSVWRGGGGLLQQTSETRKRRAAAVQPAACPPRLTLSLKPLSPVRGDSGRRASAGPSGFYIGLFGTPGDQTSDWLTSISAESRLGAKCPLKKPVSKRTVSFFFGHMLHAFHCVACNVNRGRERRCHFGAIRVMRAGSVACDASESSPPPSKVRSCALTCLNPPAIPPLAV